jgi:hypothetical protein
MLSFWLSELWIRCKRPDSRLPGQLFKELAGRSRAGEAVRKALLNDFL